MVFSWIAHTHVMGKKVLICPQVEVSLGCFLIRDIIMTKDASVMSTILGDVVMLKYASNLF